LAEIAHFTTVVAALGGQSLPDPVLPALLPGGKSRPVQVG
jgi:hypothetical protein